MLSMIFALAIAGGAPASVRITNPHLDVICVAGQSVDGKQRQWDVSEPTTFTFTMRNEPRPGVENRDPGVAVIAFSPETGHRYEIEVRGDVTAYSRRVWTRGEWMPVVRDRTTDKIISNAPRWIEKGPCSQLLR